MRQINCTLLMGGNQVPAQTAITAWLKPDTMSLLYDGHVEEDGRLIFRLPDEKPIGGATIYAELPGYEPGGDRVVLPLSGSIEGPLIDLVLTKPAIQPLRIAFPRFVTDSGPWMWKGSTDFLLFQRFLDGLEIDPVLSQRTAMGANLVRVLGMAHNISHFYPQEYSPRYYEQLRPFVDYLAKWGLYVEFVVFADQQHVKAPAQEHYANCCAVLQGAENVVIELCNEFPKNGINPHDFQKPAGLLASAGSDISDASPDIYWDFFGWHGRRDWPKLPHFDDAHGIAKRERCVVIHDEPIGASEVDIPGRRTTSALAMQSVASEAARLGAGATFHSEAGLTSALWGPVQQHLAATFYMALEVS